MKKIFLTLSAVSILLISCNRRSGSSSISSESSSDQSSQISAESSSNSENSSQTSVISSSEESSSIEQSSEESSSEESSLESSSSEEIIESGIRMPAEFEPAQAVTVTYPNNLPLSVFKEIAEDDKLIVLVNPKSNGNSRINTAKLVLDNYGVNLDNVTFYDAKIDGDYEAWIRDFSPFYVFKDGKPGAVNFNYNRPSRTEQNKIPALLAEKFGIDYYDMDLTHTGGNLMQDGHGAAMSDDLVIEENDDDEAKVRELMKEYTGTNNYHITIDPQGDYIAHIDCWGKIVAPDKIIIARLPKSNSRYKYYEQVAEYFANQNCCYGYPYRIYRVDEPGGDEVAPFTNSLIVNKKVLLPVGSDETYTQKAVEVYQEALPGYEIIPFETTNDYYTEWLNTDALHCRTHEVPDFNMVHIDHKPLYGEVSYQDSVHIESEFTCYSGATLDLDASKIHININDSGWNEYDLNYDSGNNYYYDFTGLNQGDEVSYYIEGYDQLGNHNVEPTCGGLDPFTFTVA